jgi:hypothetical protein
MPKAAERAFVRVHALAIRPKNARDSPPSVSGIMIDNFPGAAALPQVSFRGHLEFVSKLVTRRAARDCHNKRVCQVDRVLDCGEQEASWDQIQQRDDQPSVVKTSERSCYTS